MSERIFQLPPDSVLTSEVVLNAIHNLAPEAVQTRVGVYPQIGEPRGHIMFVYPIHTKPVMGCIGLVELEEDITKAVYVCSGNSVSLVSPDVEVLLPWDPNVPVPVYNSYLHAVIRDAWKTPGHMIQAFGEAKISLVGP